MKFELKIALKDKQPHTYEMGGDLDAVKTFLKLKVDLKKFNWASIKRVDEDLARGDVEYWSVRQDMHGELHVHAFAFYDVDAQININAMRRALGEQKPANLDVLGEGTL